MKNGDLRLFPGAGRQYCLVSPIPAPAPICPSSERHYSVLHFRPGKTWRGPEDDGDSPDEPPRRTEYPALTEREKGIYFLLGALGCLPFILLVILAILTHSPIIAN